MVQIKLVNNQLGVNIKSKFFFKEKKMIEMKDRIKIMQKNKKDRFNNPSFSH